MNLIHSGSQTGGGKGLLKKLKSVPSIFWLEMGDRVGGKDTF